MLRTQKMLVLCCFIWLASACNNWTKPSLDLDKELERLYITTNSGSIYALDLSNDSMLWQHEVRDSNIDELTFFSLDQELLIKDYLHAEIGAYDNRNGKLMWTHRDSVSPDQAYYGYNFGDVRFVHFYQYPYLYKDQMIFANSHGEIKSLNTKDRQEKWNYQVGIPLFTAPICWGDHLFINLGYDILKLNANTGQKIKQIHSSSPSMFPVHLGNGMLYLLSEKGTVSGLDENLTLMWESKPEDSDSSPAQDILIDDKQIVFSDGLLHAIDALSGEAQWSVSIKKILPPADTLVYGDSNYDLNNYQSLLSVNGNYIFCTKYHIVKLNKDGKLLQHYSWPKEEQLLGLTFANGFFYCMTLDGKLYKISGEFTARKVLKTDIQFQKERGLEAVYFKAE